MKYFDPRTAPAGLAFEEAPATADDIDLDRVVWDPTYRSAVKGLLVPDDSARWASPGR